MRVDFAAKAPTTYVIGEPQKVKTLLLSIDHFGPGLIKLQVEFPQYGFQYFHRSCDISPTEDDPIVRVAHDPCTNPFLTRNRGQFSYSYNSPPLPNLSNRSANRHIEPVKRIIRIRRASTSGLSDWHITINYIFYI